MKHERPASMELRVYINRLARGGSRQQQESNRLKALAYVDLMEKQSKKVTVKAN